VRALPCSMWKWYCYYSCCWHIDVFTCPRNPDCWHLLRDPLLHAQVQNQTFEQVPMCLHNPESLSQGKQHMNSLPTIYDTRQVLQPRLVGDARSLRLLFCPRPVTKQPPTLMKIAPKRRSCFLFQSLGEATNISLGGWSQGLYAAISLVIQPSSNALQPLESE
jgi:hypothetical protein